MTYDELQKELGRPPSSYEIQERLDRMPNREERSRYSDYVNRNGSPFKASQAYDDDDRFLPASDRVMLKMTGSFTDEQIEQIKELIAALIEEARR